MGITSLLICSLVILVGASLAGAWGWRQGYAPTRWYLR